MKKTVKQLGGNVKNGHLEIKSPERLGGRCRFSRPALVILHELILSGQDPMEFMDELTNNMKKVEKKKLAGEYDKKDKKHHRFGDHYMFSDNYRFRLYKDDLLFLKAMKDKDGRLNMPQISLAEKYGNSQDNNIQELIDRLIMSCSSPIVRHRLSLFNGELEELIKKNGKPDHVCLEFIREDFMSKKRKKEYEKRSNEGRKERKRSIKDLREQSGADKISDELIEEARLMREQDNKCIYTNKAFCMDKLGTGEYEIDHILPKSKRGPDAIYNKVLTFKKYNREKGAHLPVEWDRVGNDWAQYKNRVMKTIKNPRKRALLLATGLEEGQSLAEEYTGLATTGWLARLFRDVICLRMGWQPGEKDAPRHVSVISGGLTNRIAKKYNLYKCLGDGQNAFVKNRNDKRHHALDAMIISYLPEWARDKNKTDFFKFPKGVDKDYFDKKLKGVYPRVVARKKAVIAEQPLARVREYNKETKKFEYQIKQRKNGNLQKAGNYSPEIYKNLSKPGNPHSGHWYTSGSEQGEGTFSHGCLLIYPKGDKKKVEVLPIHAHSSPRTLDYHYKKKGYETVLLKRGDLIRVNNRLNITATKLGSKTFISKGVYRIEKKLTKHYDISVNKDNQELKFRISQKYVHDALKRKKTVDMMRKGGEINFEKFLYENKSPEIKGVYKFPPCPPDTKTIVLSSPRQNAMQPEVSYRKLYGYIIDKVIQTPDYDEGQSVDIPVLLSANLPDESEKNLPSDIYTLKGFANGMSQVTVETNYGLRYRLSTASLVSVLAPVKKGS